MRVILVRSEAGGNVGAAARVLRNFGIGDLVLVAPRHAHPDEARRWARGAEDLLDGAVVVPTLAEALEGCATAWATTRRRGRLRGRVLTARDAAAETATRDRSGERVAWVFGPESRGLTTAEVAQCSARVTIPTSPDQPSLNLAQAVAIACYECALAQLEESPATLPRLAPLADREALYRHLEEALRGIGFLPPGTARIRMAHLRAVFERSRLTPDELRFLRGIARRMAWAATFVPGRAGGPRPRPARSKR